MHMRGIRDPAVPPCRPIGAFAAVPPSPIGRALRPSFATAPIPAARASSRFRGRRRRAAPDAAVRFEAHYRAATALEDEGARRDFQLRVLAAMRPYFEQRLAAAEAEDALREVDDGLADKSEAAEEDAGESGVAPELAVRTAELRARAAALRGAMLELQGALFAEEVARVREDPVLDLLWPNFLRPPARRRSPRREKEARLELRGYASEGPLPEGGALLGERLCEGLREVLRTRAALAGHAAPTPPPRAPAPAPAAVEEAGRAGRAGWRGGAGGAGGAAAGVRPGYRREVEEALAHLEAAVRELEEPARTVRALLPSCTLLLRLSHRRRLVQVKLERGDDAVTAALAVERLTGLFARPEGPDLKVVDAGYAAVLVEEFDGEPEPLGPEELAAALDFRRGADPGALAARLSLAAAHLLPDDDP
eukprot:tig00000144_g9092.t1